MYIQVFRFSKVQYKCRTDGHLNCQCAPHAKRASERVSKFNGFSFFMGKLSLNCPKQRLAPETDLQYSWTQALPFGHMTNDVPKPLSKATLILNINPVDFIGPACCSTHIHRYASINMFVASI